MKDIRQKSILICVIVATVLLVLSFASYLFSGTDERSLIALAACCIALLGLFIGFMTFDDD